MLLHVGEKLKNSLLNNFIVHIFHIIGQTDPQKNMKNQNPFIDKNPKIKKDFKTSIFNSYNIISFGILYGSNNSTIRMSAYKEDHKKNRNTI